MKTIFTKNKSIKFYLLIFCAGFLINCTSSNNPVGTYKFGNKDFNIESIVDIKEDGTWTHKTYESGKLREMFLHPTEGKWILKELKLKSNDGEKIYKIICFDEDNRGYLFEDGCFSALPDKILTHSDNIYSWGSEPFGELSNGQTRCK